MATRRRSVRCRPIPPVEAEIAQLAEELPLTVAFAALLQRHGDDRAALGVVEIQRGRVDRSRRAMLAALGRRRRYRIQAALAGAAAVLVLGSASFASYLAFGPPAHAHDRLLRSASAQLTEAARADDPTQAAAIVAGVHRALSSLDGSALADREIRNDVRELLRREWQLVNQRLPQAASLASEVRSLAKRMQIALPAPEEPPARPSPEPPPAPPPSAPAP